MRRPNLSIKFWYLGAYAGFFLVALGVAVMQAVLKRSLGGASEDTMNAVVGCAVLPLGVVWVGSALWWLYDAWMSVPFEHRQVAILGQPKGPEVVLLLLVPCFNFVWMFMTNLGLVDSLNRACSARRVMERGSSSLALTACIVQCLPYCNLLLGPPLWFLYMLSVDKAREALANAEAMPG